MRASNTDIDELCSYIEQKAFQMTDDSATMYFSLITCQKSYKVHPSVLKKICTVGCLIWQLMIYDDKVAILGVGCINAYFLHNELRPRQINFESTQSGCSNKFVRKVLTCRMHRRIHLYPYLYLYCEVALTDVETQEKV